MIMGDAPGNEVERIRRAYAGGLSGKLDSLAAAWSERPPALTSLRDEAHQLAGSAPMLGFAAVGDGAARVEDAAMRMLEGDDPGRDPASASALLEAALSELRRAVAAAAEAAPR